MFHVSFKYLIFSLFLSGFLAVSAQADEKKAESDALPSLLEVKAYEVEWGGRPRDPFVAPDVVVK
ncbi:hypothetical protein [Kangiella sp.]|uniref:hypothetical protein n=1 Tax=Kangiella sp. TaxID=1920245 RepID=UPI00198EB87E|nr:hypothetical protein [Kangiella sp.]MBD3653256.1 hypothetical protein [Kangiella sp.]